MEHTTPSIPLEVVSIIISYLGKSDLLNCRLVCKEWDQECVKISKKSNFTQVLKGEKLQEYVNFVNQYPNSPLIFRFHLKLTLLFGELEGRSPYEDLLFLSVKMISLVNVFGPKCVKNLTLSTRDFNPIEITLLLELLDLISPGLEIMDFSNFKGDENLGVIFPDYSLTFPNVKKIIYAATSTSMTFMFSFMYNLPKLCPNLKKLTQLETAAPESWTFRIPLERISHFRTDVLVRPQEFLSRIRECQPSPQLQSLGFRLNFLQNENIHICSILQTLSEGLKLLRIETSPMLPSKLIPFPKLPKLESLRITLGRIDNSLGSQRRHYMKLYEYNMTSETFPSLEQIDIPIDCILISTYEELPRIIFRGVKVLILRIASKVFDSPANSNINIFHDATFPENLFMILKNLHDIFPKLEEITIINEFFGINTPLMHIMKRLIRSSLVKKIKKFEIKNCDQDYLGEVLSQLNQKPKIILENIEGNSSLRRALMRTFTKYTGETRVKLEERSEVNPENGRKKNVLTLEELEPANNHVMQEVEMIKLELSSLKERRRKWKHTSNILPSIPLHLTTIAKAFPKLKEIVVEGGGRAAHLQEIEEIEKEFPNLTITISHG